ncbi:MAG: dihydropyrimidinase [Promethearchaeota archaeon]
MDLLIKNGTIVSESTIFKADIGIQNGKIIGFFKKTKRKTPEQQIDAKGKLIFPGIVDGHVHFQLQDLGRQISSDTFEEGTKAGAFGGVTTIIDFADQTRGESPFKAYKERRAVADPQVVIDYGLHVSVTDTDHLDEIATLISEGVTSFKIFTTYSWRNLYLNDAQIYDVLLVLRKYGATAVVHCENDDFVIALREKLIKEGKIEPIYHAKSRPNFVEAEAIQRILFLAKLTGVKTHIFHVSTKEGIELLVRAKKKNTNITGETCPHYLLLNEEAYAGEKGYLNLMSPPLRSDNDRQAILHQVLDGNVDLIVTDHCEFSKESKGLGKQPFHQVLNGIPGVETSLALMHEYLINRHNLSYPRLINLLSTNPAKIFGLYPQKGSLVIGADADLVIFDTKKEITIASDNLHYEIDWNPYEGEKVKGWPVKTIVRGKVIVDDGEFYGKKGAGKYLRRSPITKISEL